MTSKEQIESYDKIFENHRRVMSRNEIHIVVTDDILPAIKEGKETNLHFFVTLQITSNQVEPMGKGKVSYDITSLSMYKIRNGEDQNISLDYTVEQNLLRYLKMKKVDYMFECSAFVLFLQGKPVRRYHGGAITDNWADPQIVLEKDLNVGDTIFICREKTKVVHWAIYLGDGQYMSKLGKGSDVGVHDQKVMIQMYDSDGRLFRVTKIEERKTKRQRLSCV
jgi:hypothetical protein